MKLNTYLYTVSLISIVLNPLAAFAEVKPQFINKNENILILKDDNRSLVKKLIESKQLAYQSQSVYIKNAAISTSAADLDLNQPDLNQPNSNNFSDNSDNLSSEELIIADSEYNSDPDKWSASRPDGHAPI